MIQLLNNDLNIDWQNIDFKNYDNDNENDTYNKREFPEKIKKIKKNDTWVLNLHLPNEYSTQQKIIKLLSNDTILCCKNGIYEINKLFQSIEKAKYQLKADFHREICSINNIKVSSYKHFIDYIDYSILNKFDKKLIFTCFTQAIMSIPLLGIHKMFDLEQYVIGEIDQELQDKTMYIDIEIYNNQWFIQIQKPLRIFDTYGTLYCVFLDIDIDKNGMTIHVKPFL